MDFSRDDLRQVRDALFAREPLFHRREFVHDVPTFDAQTAGDFWEVGASGQVYSRDDVRQVLIGRWRERPVDESVTEAWEISENRLRQLDRSTFLITYLLRQGERITRRASIWRSTPDLGWQVVYHQGTVVTDA